jgi:AraC-like DNA-binding protein
MVFLETYPANPLSHFVKSIWRMSCDLPQKLELTTRDIPNGDIQVLFNLGTTFKNIRGDNETIYKNGVIKGQQSKYLRIVQSDGFDIVGISFHPWGLYPFTGIPSQEFYNQIVDVSEIFEPALEEKLRGLEFTDQVKILNSFLLSKLYNYNSKSYLVELIAADIIRNRGLVKITSYLEKYRISQKHLVRCFHESVGLTPKKLAGLCRINNVVNTINNADSPPDWIDIVVKNNYHDQPHLINDFKQVVGLTPENYIKTNDSVYKRFFNHLKILRDCG